MDILLRDIRYAIRGLLRSRGFSAVAVLTLALGIGTNTAIFSVVDQLLLRPLPYPDGDRVVQIHETELREGDRSDVNPGNWLDWQRQSRTLEGVAAWDPGAATLTGVGEPERLQSLLVSAEFFPVLGVPPLLGRVISPEHDRPKVPRVAVLSYALWQRRFNGDPDVIGRIIQLNEEPTEIIGVMPQGFRFVFHDTDYWTAFRLDRDRAWRETAGRFISVVARVKPTATVEDARTEMEAIARGLAQTYSFNRDMTVEIVPIRQKLVGNLQASLLILYGAVGVLLAIACLNVANLLLARSISRRREIAVRSSIGAGRAAIVRQLLVESLLLAAIGGLLGVLVARWSLSTLLAFTPTELVPFGELRLDRVILMYVVGLSAVTGIIVGLVPAVTATRRSLTASLRSNGQHTTTHSPRVQQMLVVGQVAMTVVLLCGAGLLIRTVVALNDANGGFNRRNLLTMEIALPVARYTGDRVPDFFRQATEALRQLPGVDSVAAAASLPVTGTPAGRTGFHILGERELPPTEGQSTLARVVTPEYFRTLGIPVLHGREFMETDAEVLFVVNRAFASRYLRNRDPLTTAISVRMQRENPYGRIVGVVGDISEGSLWDSAEPTVFYSHRQFPMIGMVLLLRGPDVGGMTRGAVDAIRQLDPNLAVASVRTIDATLGESIARERLLAVVSTAFALSGLLLASLGVYGLLAFVVAERTREIGIRIALGARPRRLLRHVLGGGLRLVAIGAMVGVCGAIVVSRSLGFLLFNVTAYDPSTYVAVLVLLGLVASAATLIPARRAARVDPIVALRTE